MLITPTKQTIFIYCFKLNEKELIHFNKFNENNQIASLFSKFRTKLKLNKIGGPT